MVAKVIKREQSGKFQQQQDLGHRNSQFAGAWQNRDFIKIQSLCTTRDMSNQKPMSFFTDKTYSCAR